MPREPPVNRTPINSIVQFATFSSQPSTKWFFITMQVFLVCMTHTACLRITHQIQVDWYACIRELSSDFKTKRKTANVVIIRSEMDSIKPMGWAALDTDALMFWTHNHWGTILNATHDRRKQKGAFTSARLGYITVHIPPGGDHVGSSHSWTFNLHPDKVPLWIPTKLHWSNFCP